MLVMKIGRKYRVALGGTLKCANLKCQTPLEPPVSIHEFVIGLSPKVYRRPFCIDCMSRLKKAKGNVIVEVL